MIEIGPVGRVSIEPLECSAEQVRAMADAPGSEAGVPAGPASPEERVGLLRLSAKACVTLAGTTVRRKITQYRELKLTLAGPPRPFEQVGLYIGDLHRVTDPARANVIRQTVLEALDLLVRDLSSLTDPANPATAGPMSPESESRLHKIQDGLPPSDHRETRVPLLPESPAAIVGIHETQAFTLEALDIARRLAEDHQAIALAQDELARTMRSAGGDGGERVVGAVEGLVAAINRALMRLWSYQRHLRLVPRDSPEFARQFAPYEERLTPEWFAERTAAQLDPDGGSFAQWLSGKRALLGVFRIVSQSPVVITGNLAGRAVLVVDAPQLTLRQVAMQAPGDLLTIVAARGSVHLEGSVSAALVAAGGADLELAQGSTLTGGLYLPASSSMARLAGTLRWNSYVCAGETVAQAIERKRRGVYAVAFSPAPLYVTGER